MTAIPLGRGLLHGSSFLPACSASNINACLFGIAPGGGYRVSPFVTQGAAFALPGPKDSSLWPYSSPHGGRPLTVTLLYGVRTFLPPTMSASGCLAYFKRHCNVVQLSTLNHYTELPHQVSTIACRILIAVRAVLLHFHLFKQHFIAFLSRSIPHIDILPTLQFPRESHATCHPEECRQDLPA